MNTADLIHQARAHGVELWAEGPALRYRGSPEALKSLLPELKSHKAELLAALTAANDPPADPGPAPTLPPPWDAIRDRIQAGWRAVFSAPGPDGRQSIAWIPPGEWKPAEAREVVQRCTTTYQPPRAPTGSTQAHAGLSGPARCCDCQHQQPTDHPALILCGAGRESPAACGAWWKFDPRYCGQFTRATA
jgi:hypothetical protein